MKEVTDVVCADDNVIKTPDLVVVWATAVFEDSRREFLTQNDYDSLEKVLRGAKHLNENISTIEALQQSNRKLRTGQFKHSLEIKLTVKTARLWENARSYIWRNLGQNIWTKRDGEKLSFAKIHVKY